MIKDITYVGHEFLNNIRDAKIWSKTKSTVNKFSSVSLDVLATVANKLILKLLTENGYSLCLSINF
ncbi:DUF2513 domain-containing protein [Aerococcaceae bacterium DSM 111020]|nr:DUF2513 domain-containing protein [Aerococcaceae bacterium DSM 111020]